MNPNANARYAPARKADIFDVELPETTVQNATDLLQVFNKMLQYTQHNLLLLLILILYGAIYNNKQPSAIGKRSTMKASCRRHRKQEVESRME